MLPVKCFRRAAVALAASVALLGPVLANTDTAVAPPPGGTSLTLINGWKSYGFGTAKPSVSAIHGIVHLKGAIRTNGSSPNPFVLPSAFRPAALLYVPVDMCGATNGRLVIETDGTVTVQAEADFGEAQCFTSLEGVSFATSSDGFKSLTLENGWTEFGKGTANAAARNIGGVVHFEGAIATGGTNAIPFILPAALRPATEVFVKADLCEAANGRLDILPDGTVTVEPEGAFSTAECFTSLDGASFAMNSTGFTALDLINGWTNYGRGVANAAVKAANGVVQLEGAIQTSGTSPDPFVLPVGFRPKKWVYVPVDMCDATNGRLDISPDGDVTVEAESDFSKAQCFTSLDGVSFHE